MSILRKTKRSLKDLNVRPSKGRGQNFSVDPALTAAIVEFGRPEEAATIIEIGPGLGALTEKLCFAGKKLILIEVEESFCSELKQKYPNAQIINQKVQEVDFARFGDNLTVFGNIPYIFSTEIIFHLIQHSRSVKRAVLLLQKEFADRVAAPPGSRTYGVLSVMAQLWCEVRLGPVFDGTSFYPPPKVDSRILELNFRQKPLIPEQEIPWFRKVVQGSFLNRRKMLHNSLKASGLWTETSAPELLKIGITPSIRAEQLSISDLYKLSRVLYDERKVEK
jgi:16S rRNA (adenine1518-N6/adenine1519-N6)-dimethyltransferase